MASIIRHYHKCRIFDVIRSNMFLHYSGIYNVITQIWLADDATRAGSLTNLRNWWDLIQREGRKYGYFVKPSKSWLIIKDSSKLIETQDLFSDCPIKITTSGKRHLGAAIVSLEYKTSYMEEKVNEWCCKMRYLTNIANSQPQAAYSAYIHGEQHKYTYFLRTLSGIAEILKPLDDIITNEFVPALFGSNLSPHERDILSLPIKEGGLGLRVLSEIAENSYNASRKITAPLTEKVVTQSNDLPNQKEVKKASSKALLTLNEIAKEKLKIIVHQTKQ